MGIRKLKPTTPGQRHKVIGAFDKITASTPEKSLVVGKKSTGGRNNTGKMTMQTEVQIYRSQEKQRWHSCDSKVYRV